MTPEIPDSSFQHSWHVERLAARPLILPRRHHVYPALVDEVEIGALELLITPRSGDPFLATCALGFAATTVPTGIYACPHPDWICAISGGYAYLINTCNPTQWEQVEYRPVVEVLPLPEPGLLLFTSFHTITAYNHAGQAWTTGRLTSDGIRLGKATNTHLTGWGWDMYTDREYPFSIDLATGHHTEDRT